MATKFETVDEYISSFPPEVQQVIEQVRATIHRAAPEAQEKISYQMPTFFTKDGQIAYFAAWKTHVGFYSASGALEVFEEDVAPFVQEKGTLKFPLSQPMPLELIANLVRFAAQDNTAKAAQKKASKATKS